MGASSVTGTGNGSANNKTTKELSILTRGHQIVEAGRVTSVPGLLSPPSPAAVVKFSKPLPGSYNNYAIIMTPINGQSVWVATFLEDEDNNFSGFTCNSTEECDVMFIVVKIGAQVIDL